MYGVAVSFNSLVEKDDAIAGLIASFVVALFWPVTIPASILRRIRR